MLGGKLNRGMCNIIFKRANWEKDADTGELMQNDANPDEVRARHTHTRARARAHAHAPVAAIDRQSAQHAALARSRPPSPQSPAAGWALERSPSPLPRYHSYPNPPHTTPLSLSLSLARSLTRSLSPLFTHTTPLSLSLSLSLLGTAPLRVHQRDRPPRTRALHGARGMPHTLCMALDPSTTQPTVADPPNAANAALPQPQPQPSTHAFAPAQSAALPQPSLLLTRSFAPTTPCTGQPSARDLVALGGATLGGAPSRSPTLAEATERFCQDVLLPFSRRLPPDQLRPLLSKDRVQVPPPPTPPPPTPPSLTLPPFRCFCLPL